MASLTRSSSLSSKAPSLANAVASPKPFHAPKFFKVLGRIDEESSFRASSLSNTTYNDFSQDCSTTSSEEGSTERWPMTLPPVERSTRGNSNDVEKETDKPTMAIHNKHNDQTNLRMATAPRNIGDGDGPKSDAAAPERRQDRSTVIAPLVSSSTEPHHVLHSNQKHHHQHHHHQQQQAIRDRDHRRQHQRQQLAQQHRDNEALLRKCEELESAILEFRNEGNIVQMRTLVRFRNCQAEIQRANSEKQALEKECRSLEDQIREIRKETQQKRESILQAEEQYKQRRLWRLRGEQQRDRNHNGGGSNHQHHNRHANFGMKRAAASED